MSPNEKMVDHLVKAIMTLEGRKPIHVSRPQLKERLLKNADSHGGSIGTMTLRLHRNYVKNRSNNPPSK